MIFRVNSGKSTLRPIFFIFNLPRFIRIYRRKFHLFRLTRKMAVKNLQGFSARLILLFILFLNTFRFNYYLFGCLPIPYERQEVTLVGGAAPTATELGRVAAASTFRSFSLIM